MMITTTTLRCSHCGAPPNHPDGAYMRTCSRCGGGVFVPEGIAGRWEPDGFPDDAYDGALGSGEWLGEERVS
jgi:ribosomal protein S27AE